MVTARDNTYNLQPGESLYCGRPGPVEVPPVIVAGEWQQLTVAAHSRKVPIGTGNGSQATFTPTLMTALEAQAPETVTSIPNRAFSVPVQGERGVFYYTGGGHSNHQGNEIDRLQMPTGLSTEIVTTISHQPNRPPEGKFSGYASGNGSYIWRQADTATGVSALSDNSDWQPHPGHQWVKNQWSPYWGFFSLCAHALQSSYTGTFTYTVVDGVLQSSGAQPTDDYGDQEENYGVVAFDWATGKYKTQLSTSALPFPQVYLGSSGVSDWNNFDQTQLFFQNNAGTTYIHAWNPITGLTSRATTGLVGGFDGSGGNGYLVRWLEIRKYLILRQSGGATPGGFRGKLLLYSEDFGSGNDRFVELTPPAGAFTDWNGEEDALSFCVDHNSRRVFWLVFPGVTIPVRFYVSTFDDLMTWTEIVIAPDIVIPNLAYFNAWIAANRQPMLFSDGNLDVMDGSGSGPGTGAHIDGRMNWKRARVDVGSERLPDMQFTRYDYRIQNFTYDFAPGIYQHWGNKHCNWAYRPSNGKFYFNAGDCGGSTSHCRATLEFTGDEPGDYLFTQTADETSPAPAGTFRPASADDGYWFYVPTDSAWVAGRGKFVWQRGGDGEGPFWNSYLRAYYGASDQIGTTEQQAAFAADGWDITAKYYIFDPDADDGGGAFPTRINGDSGWTQDNGSTYYPNVFTEASSASSRNGYFDPTTGCVWRFYNFGSLSLAKVDFINEHVQLFNIATWVSPDTSRTIYASGAPAEDASEILADGSKPGFCHIDTGSGRYIHPMPLEWEHKATWLNPADGKLYVVNPVTGYLWCFETRATPVDSGNGWTIPFYPVGKRVPLVGTYPAVNARDVYPPEPAPGTDPRMSQFLVPFKGGLLWWGSVHHTGGTFGYPVFAFWRRLGYLGDWSVVSMPKEFAANAFAAIDPYDIDNNEVVLLSGGGNYIDTQGPWPFFWRLT